MSPDRTPFIAGNWKMYKTIAEAEEFISGLLPKVSSIDGVDVAICVPFLALQAMVDSARGSRVEVYAQTMHDADEGAFTGEVSPKMLAEIDVGGVVLGHSERRELFGESDETVNLKVRAIVAAGMTPILCVGETLAEREAGTTESKVTGQVKAGLDGLTPEQVGALVVAYEPIWAIGTGRTASSEDAQAVCERIRQVVGEVAGADAAATVRVQYGGSVKAENAAELMAQPDIDGALVGGASLDAESFAGIVRYRARQ
jgi:triosephosphate isomerase